MNRDPSFYLFIVATGVLLLIICCWLSAMAFLEIVLPEPIANPERPTEDELKKRRQGKINAVLYLIFAVIFGSLGIILLTSQPAL